MSLWRSECRARHASISRGRWQPKPTTIALLVIAAALTTHPFDAAAAELRAAVAGSGGGHVWGSLHDHWCTVGQSVAGLVANATHRVGIGFWHPVCGQASGIPHAADEVPTEFALMSNSLGSAIQSSSITYAVPVSAHVSIRLFDAAGRQTSTVVHGVVEPGVHESRLPTSNLTTGIYFCRMNAGRFSATRKLVLLR